MFKYPKTKGAILLISLLGCVACKAPVKESTHQPMSVSPAEAACFYTLKAKSSNLVEAGELTGALGDLFKANMNMHVDYVDFDGLQTVVLATSHQCGGGMAREALHSVQEMLKQYGLPYALGTGPAGMRPRRADTRAASTLAELVSIASNGQAQLRDCTFVFDYNSGAIASPQQEQTFRAELSDANRYGIPLLYSFVLDGKLNVVFYEQCRSGLKMMEFVQKVLGPSQSNRISRPRRASPQEVQRLLDEAGGPAG